MINPVIKLICRLSPQLEDGRFVGITQLHDALYAVTEFGTVYKIVEDYVTGDVHLFEKEHI